MQVQIVLFDEFDPMDAVAPYEVLAAAELIDGTPLAVELVTTEGPRAVSSGTPGFELSATGKADPERADLIILPGAAGRMDVEDGHPDSVPVRLATMLASDLPAVMAEALDDPSTVVATVCGGSALLAMAGLIEGRYAVTHHLGLDLLEATGVNVVRGARVVDDGDLISAGGVTSGLDLGLHLIDRFYGSPLAREIEALIEYERRGVVWRSADLEREAS